TASATLRDLHSFPPRRSSDLGRGTKVVSCPTGFIRPCAALLNGEGHTVNSPPTAVVPAHVEVTVRVAGEDARLVCILSEAVDTRSEEHTSELQSRENLVCRLL